MKSRADADQMNTSTSRRRLLRAGLVLGSSASLPLAGCASQGRSKATVVIVGGGFAGASCARELRNNNPDLHITLVEPKQTYSACPLSNLVIAGERSPRQQQFGYQALTAANIRVLHSSARDVDALKQQVTLGTGQTLPYDRLIMAPGISLNFAALDGYSAAVAEQLPHAWQAGAQTTLLRDQLTAMPDGGTVAMAVPENPYRCPPGPYERASLIAHYLQKHKPKAKLLVLDSKDNFSKKALFLEGWSKLYGDLIEWQGAADGARVVRVEAATRTLHTDFDSVRADVANVIPPQRAGLIAQRAGLTDASGWCPIKPVTFESTLQPNVHVIGDAAIANAMPKSAFAANAQARLCAVQVARLLQGDAPVSTQLLNTCYSLIAPDYGISVAGVYQPTNRAWEDVAGAGGSSPLAAATTVRAQEAHYARDWFAVLTTQVFG